MRKAAASSSSRTPAPTPVTVIWDFAHAWIPNGYDIKALRRNIQVALRKRNPGFFIDKLIAMGPGHGDRYQAILTCPDDISFKPIPREDFPGEHTNTDFYVVKEMHMTTLESVESEKHLLVIDGVDMNLWYAMDALHDGGSHVMIARLENSTGQLHRSAKAIWLWTSQDPNKAVMVTGGAPIRSRG